METSGSAARSSREVGAASGAGEFWGDLDRVNVSVDDGGVPTHNLTPRYAVLERIAVNQKFISKLRKHFDVDLS